jgi:hypothetical protein
MSEENKYKFYSAADIEKYHKGLLSSKEMNELEKAALDDPFLADALEGYGKVPVSSASDMEELEKKLEARVSGAKVVPISRGLSINRFLKVAAVVVFVSAAALAIYKFGFEKENAPLATKIEKQKSPATPIVTDTNNNSSPIVDKNITTGIGTTQQERKKTESNWATSSDAVSSYNVSPSTVTDKDATSKSVYKVDDGAVVSQRPVDTVKTFGNFKTEAEQKPVANSINEVVISDAERKQKKSVNKKVNQSQPSAVMAPAGYYDKSNVRKDSSIGVGNEQLKNNTVAANYFRGRVTDNYNNALPFANISNIKDNVGTYADAQGNFILISSDSVLNVRVKSVGFIPDTVALQSISGYNYNWLASKDQNLANYNKVVLKEDNVQGIVLGGKRAEKIPSPQQNIQVEESEPADGWSNYNLYVANNIKVPDQAKESQLHHEVKLSFEVNNFGEPVDIKVENSNCKECNQEAIRLLKEGPKWKPKKKKSRVTLTIPF